MKSVRMLTLCMVFFLLLGLTTVYAKKSGPPPIITVTIGDIVASTDSRPNAQAIADIAITDVNSYFANANLPYRLQADIQDAQGRTDTHQTLVVDYSFRSPPVNLLLAGRWSSQAETSLPYCNAFNMLMLSPSSTSSYYLSVAGDNLFRLCPSDIYVGTSLAHVLWSKGIEHVVFIQRSDAWGDQLYIQFIKEYTALGGSLTGEPVRYPTEAYDFTNYLVTAEGQVASAISAYGPSKVGVVLAAFNEASGLLNQVKSSYPNLYSCTWFGADGTARSQYIIDGAPEAVAHVKLYSLLPKETHGPGWDSVALRYATATGGLSFGIYEADEYDIFWIYALSIAKAGSADPMAVKNVLPSVAAKYNGVSGNCVLDQYGDRPNSGFDIWGYSVVGGTVQSINVGSVDTRNIVIWS